MKINLKKILGVEAKEDEEHAPLLNQFFSLTFRKLADIGVEKLGDSRITPNQISIARAVIFLPLIFYMYSKGTFFGNLMGIVCCLINSLFDHFDGNYARAKSLTSKMGAWLDHSLDKFLVYVVLVGIIYGSYITTKNSLFLIAGLIVLSLHGMIVNVSEELGKEYGELVFLNFRLKEAVYNNKKATFLDKVFLNMFGFHSYWSYIFFAVSYQVAIGTIFQIMPYMVYFWVFAFSLRLVFLHYVYSFIITKKKSGRIFINELRNVGKAN